MSSETKQAFQVIIRMLTGREIYISVTSDTLIVSLKESIESLISIPADQQRLIFAVCELEDGSTLGSYNIQPKSTIHMVLRLRGGYTSEAKDPMFDELSKKIPAGSYFNFCLAMGVGYNKAGYMLERCKMNHTDALRDLLVQFDLRKAGASQEELETALIEADVGGLCVIVKKHYDQGLGKTSGTSGVSGPTGTSASAAAGIPPQGAPSEWTDPLETIFDDTLKKFSRDLYVGSKGESGTADEHVNIEPDKQASKPEEVHKYPNLQQPPPQQHRHTEKVPAQSSPNVRDSTDESSKQSGVIRLDKHQIEVRVPPSEHWSDKYISVRAITEVPPELVGLLKKTEAIICVGLEISSDATFSTPVKVTLPHSAIFTNPDGASIGTYYRENSNK